MTKPEAHDGTVSNEAHVGAHSRLTQIGHAGQVIINTAAADGDARVVVGVPPRPPVTVPRLAFEPLMAWPTTPGVEVRLWSGLPGFGKTALAHDFVERTLAQGSAQAAVWFDCTDQSTVTASLRETAHHTTPANATGAPSWADVATEEELVRHWLRWVNARRTPILVVFDGWDNPAVPVAPLIPRHAHPGGVAVVTTTSPQVAADTNGTHTAIDRLARSESIAMLQRGRRSLLDTPEVLDRLAEQLLHDIPVAVGLAAAWGRHHQLAAYSELITLLEASSELLLQPLDGYQRTIDAFWSQTQMRLSPDARAIADQLAYVRVSTIDLTLHRLGDRTTVAELADHGLLNINVTDDGRLVASLHQTIAAAIRTGHDQAERHLAINALLTHAVDILGSDGGSFEVWDAAEAVDSWIDRIPYPQPADGWGQPLHRCLNRLSEYRLYGRPKLTRARSLIDRCEMLTSRPDQLDSLATRRNVGRWTGEAGNPGEAVRLYNELLADQVRILGHDAPETLTTRHNIAYAIGQTGKHREALRLYRDLLTEQSRIVGPDHPHTLTTRTNLAYSTGEAGNPGEALRLYNELLADQTRILGPDVPETLTTRHNIAYSTGQTGNPGEAVSLYNELLADQVRVLGLDHPHTLTARANIAYSTGQTGNPGEALRLYNELLADQTRILGPDHPHTLTTRRNIAYSTNQTGNPGEALRLYNELLADQIRVLGPDHPHTLTTRRNIAYSTNQSGNPGEAVRLDSDLLVDQTRILGADHPETLTTRRNIAYCTDQAGNPGEAVRLYNDLLADQIRVLGADHPSTLTTRANLAYSTRHLGSPVEALRLYDDLLSDQTRILGTDHPETLATRRNIAYCTGQAGNHREAVRLYNELLADQARVLGPDHPHTLGARASVAFSTGHDGKPREALRLYNSLVTDQTRILGPDHPNTLATRRHIASSTGQNGNHGEALRLYKELLADQTRILGPDHPNTLATRANVASSTGQNGDPRGALRLCNELLADQLRILGPKHPNTLTTRTSIRNWKRRTEAVRHPTTVSEPAADPRSSR